MITGIVKTRMSGETKVQLGNKLLFSELLALVPGGRVEPQGAKHRRILRE
jgi:hypothetical protein